MDKDEARRQALLAELLADPPSVHLLDSGNGERLELWSTEDSCYRLIARFTQPGDRTLETGCGLSTALFAALGTYHRCVTPAVEEVELLQPYLKERRISTERLTFEVEPSQVALPHLDGELDLVLIDGWHGFPVPIIDWFYAGQLLRAGGLLIVDDLQLPGVRVLVHFLQSNPRWELVEKTKKWAAFRRLSVTDLAEGWWDHVFWALEPQSPRVRIRKGVNRAGRAVRALRHP